MEGQKVQASIEVIIMDDLSNLQAAIQDFAKSIPGLLDFQISHSHFETMGVSRVSVILKYQFDPDVKHRKMESPIIQLN